MPEQKKRGFKLYFGWWMVIITGACGGLSYGFYHLGLSVFFKDIAAELNLGRAATSVATGIGRLEGGLTSPLIGWLSDRAGYKRWIIVGIAISSTGLILMRYITEVWHYYVVWGVLVGIGMNIGLTVAVDKALTNWFVRRRGLAQGIRFSILSLFQIIALQVTTPMVLATDWRVTNFIWGFILMAFIPLVLFLIREGRPEQYGLLPDGADVDYTRTESRQDLVELGTEYASGIGETEFTFRQAAKTITYWTLIVALGLQTLITGGFTIHVIPFLTDRGLDTSVATYLMGMMVFFAIPARFFGGIIADRLRVSRLGFLLSAALCLHVIGIGSFLLFRNTPSMYALLICYGLSMGAGTPLLILILGRFFGRKAFGAILGTSLAIFAPLGLISPVYCGWVYDTYGNYDAVFVTFIIAAALASLVSLTIRPPKKPTMIEGNPRF